MNHHHNPNSFDEEEVNPFSISEAEDATPMTVDEIFDKVLPPRSGYVQGSSPRPKPKRKSHAVEEAKHKEAEDRAMRAEELNAELLQQVVVLKSHQDKLEESLMQKLRDEVNRHFQESGYYSPFPLWVDNVAGGS